ncbi:HK97 family phage prohead protease [Clostridium sp. UBA1056]|uniref:HK97 family phage prohead protease n=1 Tax=unclassified Clostridium TaxID=2614128 RepID=UPI003216BF27
MRYEIRDNSVHIEGYVNITERDSEVLMENGERFVEQTMKGMWKRALHKAKSIPMLLNHSWNNQIASTEDNLELYEDEIGLRFAVDITSEIAIESIKRKGLSGCSFGFRALKEKKEQSNKGCIRRLLEDIELSEVSLLTTDKIPAYSGSLAEIRAEGEEAKEIRIFTIELDSEEVSGMVEEKVEDTNEVDETIDTEDDSEELNIVEDELDKLRAYIFIQKNK